MSSPAAIPVRYRTRTLRQMCIEHDPEFHQDSQRPVSYEFAGGRRVFREITASSGPYAPDS